MPPTVSIVHYFNSQNQQNRTEVLFYYSLQQHTSTKACLDRSDFFQGKRVEHFIAVDEDHHNEHSTNKGRHTQSCY